MDGPTIGPVVGVAFGCAWGVAGATALPRPWQTWAIGSSMGISAALVVAFVLPYKQRHSGAFRGHIYGIAVAFEVAAIFGTIWLLSTLARSSLSIRGVHAGNSAKARALARRCNEFSAKLIHSRPDRFGGFACLPLPDLDASLEELSYALDVLKFDGFVLFTNSNGVYLGDPAFIGLNTLD